MDDLKVIIASNIINLRTAAGLTQLELAQRLNYSDKSVSKWERAESIPDVYVLKQIADIFGVTVDYLITSHDDWAPPAKKRSALRTGVVTAMSVAAVWSIALLIFIIFWLWGSIQWIIFVYALPVSLTLLLIFNSIWHKGHRNYIIIAALAISILASIYLAFLSQNWWQIFLLAIPAVVIAYLSSWLIRRKK